MIQYLRLIQFRRTAQPTVPRDSAVTSFARLSIDPWNTTLPRQQAEARCGRKPHAVHDPRRELSKIILRLDARPARICSMLTSTLFGAMITIPASFGSFLSAIVSNRRSTSWQRARLRVDGVDTSQFGVTSVNLSHIAVISARKYPRFCGLSFDQFGTPIRTKAQLRDQR